MPKYRKKPVVVEAYQTDTEMDIATLEGVMHASVGDYIITGVNGEQYPCKQDIFAKTYEPVDVLRCGQWISVEDRMPSDGATVLVTYIGCNNRAPHTDAIAVRQHEMADNYAGAWYWYDNYGIRDYPASVPITHWMPLPEPPEEERL